MKRRVEQHELALHPQPGNTRVVEHDMVTLDGQTQALGERAIEPAQIALEPLLTPRPRNPTSAIPLRSAFVHAAVLRSVSASVQPRPRPAR